MELLKLTNGFREIFGVENISDAPDKLFDVIFNCKVDLYDSWSDFCNEPDIDNMQPIFQYYLADRVNKKQDYTPKSLAILTCMIAGVHKAKKVYDMCAGSGALTIQAWAINPKASFICWELDERVIPFLIFNLASRNINATVIHGDILSEEQIKAYSIQSGEKYSTVAEISVPIEVSADCCISNPPYNIKWEPPIFGVLNKRYRYGVPSAINANFAFILAAIQAAENAVLILPNSVLESDINAEKEIRENLIEENIIDSIILNPDNMFESTSIGTCLFSAKKNKQTATVEIVDARKTYTEEIRLQNGQFGNSSHTGRTYQKCIKIYSPENINSIISAIENRRNRSEFSAAVTKRDLKEKGYSLSPSKHIAFEYKEPTHRSYSDIIRELNAAIKEKNSCKMVINETLAKALGLDIALFKREMASDAESEKLMEKLSGEKLIKSDYITFTKNKGEFILKANDPERLPELFMIALMMWKQHIAECNNRENILLAEYRDALLPDLMSGKIKL